MEIIIYALGVISAIGLSIGGALFSSYRRIAIWIFCFSSILAVFCIFLYWDQHELKEKIIAEKELKDKSDKREKEQRTQIEDSMEEPTFSEAIDVAYFTLGNNTFSYNIDLLKEPKKLMTIYGTIPFKIYIKGKKLYTDIKVIKIGNFPGYELKDNVLIGRPIKWDLNKSKNALEIVNDKLFPVFQLFYKSPNHIVFNGIITIPGQGQMANGVILLNESGMKITNELPVSFSMKRIFKYPSWKFPSQFDEAENLMAITISKDSLLGEK